MKVIVEDMTCGHCVATIQKKMIMIGLKAVVNIADKSVSFSNEKDLLKGRAAIIEAGFSVKK